MSALPESAADRATLRHATRRLTVQTVVVVAALVVVLTAAAVTVVLVTQEHTEDTALAVTVARADDVVDPPAGVWLTIRSASGQVTTAGAPPGVADDGALTATAATGAVSVGDVERAGLPLRVRTERVVRAGGPGAGVAVLTVQAALDLSADHAERDMLVATLVAVGVAGLALAGLAGRWVARRAVSPLTEALAVQRRFVADAGHELRTPLTLLSTRAQMLHRRLRDDGTPEARDEAAAVVADAAHLGGVLEDLVLSIASSRLGPDRERVDLDGLARDVVGAGAATADRAGVVLARSTRIDDRPWYVDGSAVALRRAITALVDNAVRHARGSVVVSLAGDRRRAVLEVRDDGPGVDPAAAPTMFDRFATAGAGAGPRDTTGRRRYGLGLALVAEIAHAHGGTVELAPAPPGGGATLRLVLPRRPD